MAAFRDICNSGLTEALIELRRYEEAGRVMSSIQGAASREEAEQAFLDELGACIRSGEKALQAQDAIEAMDLLTGAIRVDTTLAKEIGRPRNGKLHALRAQCYIKTDDLEMALEDYQLALQHDPEQRDALLGRAKCLSAMGRAKDAKIAYQVYLDLRPDDKEALEGLEEVREKAAAEEARKIANLSSMLKQLVPPKSKDDAA